METKDKQKIIANKLRKSAARYLKKWMKEFEGEKSMEKMFVRDSKDWNKIADLVENSKLKQAARKMIELDTASRESIPNYIYNWIYNYL